MQDEDQRTVWRRGWLWSLYEFTSLEEQEALWSARKPGQIGDFVECMRGYFDDTLHGKPLDAFVKNGYLSEAEFEAAKEFHKLADRYHPPNGDDYDSRAILDDPEWHTVVRAAQRTWQDLQAIIVSPAEQAIMRERARCSS